MVSNLFCCGLARLNELTFTVDPEALDTQYVGKDDTRRIFRRTDCSCNGAIGKLIRMNRTYYIIFAFAFFGVSGAFGQSQTLIPFELADQYDVVHSSQSTIGKHTVLIISDRDGSAHSEKWGQAIQGLINELPHPDNVSVFAVAHVEGVPSFLRSFVQKLIKSDRNKPVLLDWQGQVNQEYGIVPGRANVFLFAPNGNLQLRFAANEVTLTKLKEVQMALKPGF